jgi:hypothetical protein
MLRSYFFYTLGVLVKKNTIRLNYAPVFSLSIISICLITASDSVFQIKVIMYYNSLKKNVEVAARIIQA